MASPQRLLATIVPLSILICYGVIRFVNLPRYSMDRLKITNATDLMHEEPFKSVDGGILTSALYESDFRTIQKGVCPNFGQDLLLLVIVVSKSYHISRRMAVRKTWGHYALRNDISVAFLFGSKTDVISSELDLYSDMIIEGNVDTEINRTLKSISMMEFVATRCPKVQYVLKANDDVFLNVPSLINIIHQLNISAKAMYGNLHRNNKPAREFGSKMYISHNQYNGSILPDYLSGQAYLFPGHIAKGAYFESLNQIYIPIEEIFLTGIVANKSSIKRVGLDEFKHVHHMHDVHGRKYSSIIFKADVPSKQFKYWMKFNNPERKGLI